MGGPHWGPMCWLFPGDMIPVCRSGIRDGGAGQGVSSTGVLMNRVPSTLPPGGLAWRGAAAWAGGRWGFLGTEARWVEPSGACKAGAPSDLMFSRTLVSGGPLFAGGGGKALVSTQSGNS